jgi:hypothetical protein
MSCTKYHTTPIPYQIMCIYSYIYVHSVHTITLSLKILKEKVMACRETYPIAKIYFIWWTIVINDLSPTYDFKENNPKAINIQLLSEVTTSGIFRR